MIDLPVWEWMRFAPSAASSNSAIVADFNSYYIGGTPRYAYYYVATLLYRYDTWTDS